MTDPLNIPQDVAEKLLKIRDAVIMDDKEEAYHWLYKIADHDCIKYNPWSALELAAGKINLEEYEKIKH